MIDMSVNEATSSIGSVLWNIIVKVSIAFAFVAGLIIFISAGAMKKIFV